MPQRFYFRTEDPDSDAFREGRIYAEDEDAARRAIERREARLAEARDAVDADGNKLFPDRQEEFTPQELVALSDKPLYSSESRPTKTELRQQQKADQEDAE